MPETNTERAAAALAARGKQHPAPSPAAIARLDPHPAPPPPTPDDGDPHLTPAEPHDPARAARMFRL